jgi:hypothetical protein
MNHHRKKASTRLPAVLLSGICSATASLALVSVLHSFLAYCPWFHNVIPFSRASLEVVDDDLPSLWVFRAHCGLTLVKTEKRVFWALEEINR